MLKSLRTSRSIHPTPVLEAAEVIIGQRRCGSPQRMGTGSAPLAGIIKCVCPTTAEVPRFTRTGPLLCNDRLDSLVGSG